MGHCVSFSILMSCSVAVRPLTIWQAPPPDSESDNVRLTQGEASQHWAGGLGAGGGRAPCPWEQWEQRSAWTYNTPPLHTHALSYDHQQQMQATQPMWQ